MHDLEKVIETTKDDFKQAKVDFSTFKAQVTKEKKEAKKKDKKDKKKEFLCNLNQILWETNLIVISVMKC